jgi:hypothetical protein
MAQLAVNVRATTRAIQQVVGAQGEGGPSPGAPQRHPGKVLPPARAPAASGRPCMWSSKPQRASGDRSESEPLLCKHPSDLRPNRATPQVDRDWVRRKNRKLLIHKPSPCFVVGGRNRRQHGKAGGDRRSECAGETIPSNFEFPELVQQDKVTCRCDIPLHRGRSGNGTDSIKVTHSHAGA